MVFRLHQKDRDGGFELLKSLDTTYCKHLCVETFHTFNNLVTGNTRIHALEFFLFDKQFWCVRPSLQERYIVTYCCSSVQDAELLD